MGKGMSLFGSKAMRNRDLFRHGVNPESLSPYNGKNVVTIGKNNYNNFIKVIPVDLNLFKGSFIYGKKIKASYN